MAYQFEMDGSSPQAALTVKEKKRTKKKTECYGCPLEGLDVK